MIRQRHLYVLLFALPALLVSIIGAAMMLAVSAGALWLFVFGDDPWPAVAEILLGAAFLLGSVGLWAALLAVAYTIGKQQEVRPTLNTGHVALLSVGATVVLLAVIVARLMGLSFGTQSDSIVCADFCRTQGFAASGMPPQDSGNRTCSCYDAQGREVRQVPLSTVAPTP